jgi:hypothetical protein
MKTATITSEKDERAAWIQRRRDNHHRALETLARTVNCETNGLTLWRQLRRVENWLSSYSTQHCNGEGGIDSDKWEEIKDQGRAKIAKIFGGRTPDGVFINSDPRGHAIKLDNEKVDIPQGMDTDWGGYGILAAEIN